MINKYNKTRKRGHAYEIWALANWKWHVLKKWQADDSKQYARWFCDVHTPIVPDGEMGDVYVSEILESGAVLVERHEECPDCYK